MAGGARIAIPAGAGNGAGSGSATCVGGSATDAPDRSRGEEFPIPDPVPAALVSDAGRKPIKSISGTSAGAAGLSGEGDPLSEDRLCLRDEDFFSRFLLLSLSSFFFLVELSSFLGAPSLPPPAVAAVCR